MSRLNRTGRGRGCNRDRVLSACRASAFVPVELAFAEFPVHVSPSYFESLLSPPQESLLGSLVLESPLQESLLDSLVLESPLQESLLDSLELESPLQESFELAVVVDPVQLPSVYATVVGAGVGP